MLKQPNHPQTTAAVPVLIEETLAAQSADIDTVSGATITSDAYKESLQAAIDDNANGGVVLALRVRLRGAPDRRRVRRRTEKGPCRSR